MDMTTLANRMLQWEQAKLRLNELEAVITGMVLEIGKTQTVGNVRATFSGGRKSFDYVTAGNGFASEEIVNRHTETKTTVNTDWRSVCKEAEIGEIPFTQSEPRVTVKLL